LNTFDLKPLTAKPNLDQYRKQAKDLAIECRLGIPEALERLESFHPKPEKFADPSSKFSLSEAQAILAREHGFPSWPKFVRFIEELLQANSTASRFEAAADAIVRGHIGKLRQLLHESPQLIRERSERVHRATLLHYVGANGVENYRQKTPKNAVEILNLLLAVGAEVDAFAEIYGRSTTLGLVATSGHPAKAGVQIELLETLISAGANPNIGPGSMIRACLQNGHAASARFLADRGGSLDLETAAGVGELATVQRLFKSAPASQAAWGLKWASASGYLDVMTFLLDRNVDIADASGGMTALHLAVIGGQLEAVRLLLNRGAPTDIVNRFGGTPLGQALWCAANDSSGMDFWPIVAVLERTG
jgi:hypothetical protein